jgi:hypothetical protein
MARYYALEAAELLPDHERLNSEYARIANEIRRKFIKLDAEEEQRKKQLPLARQLRIEEKIRVTQRALALEMEARDARARMAAQVETDPFADELDL